MVTIPVAVVDAPEDGGEPEGEGLEVGVAPGGEEEEEEGAGAIAILAATRSL